MLQALPPDFAYSHQAMDMVVGWELGQGGAAGPDASDGPRLLGQVGWSRIYPHLTLALPGCVGHTFASQKGGEPLSGTMEATVTAMKTLGRLSFGRHLTAH